MIRKEIDSVISIVSDVTEISSQEILSKSRQADIVDARCLCIKILHTMGYLPSRISKYFGLTEVAIRRSLNLFDDRVHYNKLFVRMWKDIQKQLEEKEKMTS